MTDMNWTEAETYDEVKPLIGFINRADLGNGNVFHSVRISRKNEDGKPTQFLRPSDLEKLGKFADGVRYWIQADIEEIRNKLATKP